MQIPDYSGYSPVAEIKTSIPSITSKSSTTTITSNSSIPSNDSNIPITSNRSNSSVTSNDSNIPTASNSSNACLASHVWYACYGSNLSFKRFSCYIQGGRPTGANRTYPGCTDPTLPGQNKPYTIHHMLYFAQSSPIWEHKGVAFLHPDHDTQARTYGRIYRITTKQFVQVLRQENGCAPDDSSIIPDLQQIIHRGHATLGKGWYSHILFLGYHEDVPILTFTHSTVLKPNPPGTKYLRTILSGLRECYPSLTDSDVDEYFRGCGVENLNGADLCTLVAAIQHADDTDVADFR